MQASSTRGTSENVTGLLLTDAAKKRLAPPHHLSVSLEEARQHVARKVIRGRKLSIMDR